MTSTVARICLRTCHICRVYWNKVTHNSFGRIRKILRFVTRWSSCGCYGMKVRGAFSFGIVWTSPARRYWRYQAFCWRGICIRLEITLWPFHVAVAKRWNARRMCVWAQVWDVLNARGVTFAKWTFVDADLVKLFIKSQRLSGSWRGKRGPLVWAHLGNTGVLSSGSTEAKILLWLNFTLDIVENLI